MWVTNPGESRLEPEGDLLPSSNLRMNGVFPLSSCAIVVYLRSTRQQKQLWLLVSTRNFNGITSVTLLLMKFYWFTGSHRLLLYEIKRRYDSNAVTSHNQAKSNIKLGLFLSNPLLLRGQSVRQIAVSFNWNVPFCRKYEQTQHSILLYIFIYNYNIYLSIYSLLAFQSNA